MQKPLTAAAKFPNCNFNFERIFFNNEIPHRRNAKFVFVSGVKYRFVSGTVRSIVW